MAGKRGTGPKTKSKADLDRLKAEVAKLDRRGYTQTRIAEMIPSVMGFSVCQQRVGQIIQEIRKGYQEQQRQDVGAALWEKLEQLRETRAEAWDAWERSKEDAVITTKEKALRATYKTLEGKRVVTGQKMQVTKEIKEVAGRLPENAYLATIIRCLELEAKLEGLLAPDVLNNILNNNVSFDWTPLMKPPEIHGLDSIEQRIAHEEALGQQAIGGTNGSSVSESEERNGHVQQQGPVAGDAEQV